MTKKAIILLMILMFVIGGIIGWFSGGATGINFTTWIASDRSMLRIAVDVKMGVHVLQLIKEKNIEKAVNWLEMELDSSIIGLRIIDKHTEDTNKGVKESINLAKKYRAKHPRKTQNQEIDRAVSEVLSKNYSD
jgi:preprotein translocase subunit SecD